MKVSDDSTGRVGTGERPVDCRPTLENERAKATCLCGARDRRTSCDRAVWSLSGFRDRPSRLESSAGARTCPAFGSVEKIVNSPQVSTGIIEMRPLFHSSQEELAFRVLGGLRNVGISRTFQKQRGTNLLPMSDLLLSWRRLLAKHDRALWLESEHAQKHAGCNIWVLDRDQPINPRSLPRCGIDRRPATVLTAAGLEERNLSMSVPRRSGDVAVWPMTA